MSESNKKNRISKNQIGSIHIFSESSWQPNKGKDERKEMESFLRLKCNLIKIN